MNSVSVKEECVLTACRNYHYILSSLGPASYLLGHYQLVTFVAEVKNVRGLEWK